MSSKVKLLSTVKKTQENIALAQTPRRISFMDAFLQPIYEFRDTPILLHIGGCKNTAVRFVPVLFAFISDTKEANDICGIKGAPLNKLRCRMCLSPEPMHRTYKDPEMVRTDAVSEVRGRRGQEAWIASMLGQQLSPGQINSLV